MMGETSAEQLALIGFAARLGTAVSYEDGIANEGDLRSEAQLLMNLLVSNPVSRTRVIGKALDVVNPYFEEEQGSESLKKSVAFSFSCPSLSLDGKSPQLPESTPIRERLPSDGSESSVPALVKPPAPIISMGRPLVVDDRDALRLSAEAMARNIMRTFQKAVQWRKQCWVNALGRPLVDLERQVQEAGGTEKELKQLLETPAAKVIASLNHTAVDVIDARTSFRVLPQLWDRKKGTAGAPPEKRQKVEDSSNDPPSHVTAHILSFQAVLRLSSPAGFSEVTLEAPGIIEGTFTTSSCNETTLTGVTVEVDTRVLAAMIEKSSRIIARSSAEVFIDPSGTETEDVPPSTPSTVRAEQSTPRRPSSSSESEQPAYPALVTPGNKSPPNAYCDSDSELSGKACIPLPDDLSGKSYQRSVLRMVSPQPGSSSSAEVVDYNPRTPTKAGVGPSLVSPPPSRHSSEFGGTEYLSFDNKPGPSLPALVEVACAAMQKN